MMLLGPAGKCYAPSHRDTPGCRQQTKPCAVIGACSVLVSESESPASRACYSKYTDDASVGHAALAPRQAGLAHIVTTDAAADVQRNPGSDSGARPQQQYSFHVVRRKSWTHLHSRLLNSLKQQPDLLPQGSRVLVAVSGGQDSMALLRLLIDLQRQSSKSKTAPWPLDLVVAHCDHSMREDSAQNEAFVRLQALHMGAWLRFKTVHVAAEKRQHREQPGVHAPAGGDFSKALSMARDLEQLQDAQQPPWLPLLQELSLVAQPQLSRIDQSKDAGQQQLQDQLLQEQLERCLQDCSSVLHTLAAANLAAAAPRSRKALPNQKEHQTRLQQNSDSAMMEDFVHPQADRLGLQYLVRRAECLLKSEAEARSWRHKMLAEMASEAGCTHIVLGHTATDRAETMLFNLIRGAGPSGLSSMGWDRPVDDTALQLVRPLLNFSREETAEVCKLTGTQIYEDSTNSDDQYSRNRLRLRVFPQLAAVNPQAVQHIVQTCDLLQADSSLLDSLAQRHLQEGQQLCILSRPAQQDSAGKQTALRQVQQGDFLWQLAAAQQHHGRVAVMERVGNCFQQLLQDHHSRRGPIQESLVSMPAGLNAEKLLQLHKALRYRVLHSWLEQQQAVNAASYSMVHEVQQLLMQQQAGGVLRTSTLCAEHCVVRHRGVLLFLHNSQADDLAAGKLRIITEQQEQLPWLLQFAHEAAAIKSGFEDLLSSLDQLATSVEQVECNKAEVAALADAFQKGVHEEFADTAMHAKFAEQLRQLHHQQQEAARCAGLLGVVSPRRRRKQRSGSSADLRSSISSPEARAAGRDALSKHIAGKRPSKAATQKETAVLSMLQELAKTAQGVGVCLHSSSSGSSQTEDGLQDSCLPNLAAVMGLER